MMKVILFDTLKANKTLTNAGVGKNEAEAIVTMTYESVSELCRTTFETFATKADLEFLHLRIKYLLVSAALAAVIAVSGFLLNLTRLLG